MFSIMVPSHVKGALIELITNNDIFLGIRRSCPHCSMLLKTLEGMSLVHRAYVMDESDPMLDSLRTMARTAFNFSTLPLVFLKGRFIGGNQQFQQIKKQVPDLLQREVLDQSLVLTKDGMEHSLGRD